MNVRRGHDIDPVTPDVDRGGGRWPDGHGRSHAGPGRCRQPARPTLATVTLPAGPATPRPPRRQALNDMLKTARFVGPETLQGVQDRYVDHWRVGVVAGSTRPGQALRFPIALGDIYVDQKDPGQWWQVLQFGLQNLYDPQLDEWFTMTTFSHRPGKVTLPARCT
jgi:hypothetical protein